MGGVVNVAGIQSNPTILAKEANLAGCLASVKNAAQEGADLIVFPECSLTGYCFSSLDEALTVAEPVPGPSVNVIAALCAELGVYVVIGLLERVDDKCFNAVALVGPEGFVGKYRKLHLPYLGVDRFATQGDLALRVFDTAVGKLGMNICFDSRFLETVRILALLGAEIVLLPTNWPEGAEFFAEIVVNTRAYENRVHFVAVDRVGWERGFRFIGRSKIIHCSGVTLAEASASNEEIIYAQLSLDEPREKHLFIKKNEFEVPLFRGRRPEFYGLISDETWFREDRGLYAKSSISFKTALYGPNLPP